MGNAVASMAAYKGGGKVKGPGTGTSDSVPVRLSKGEFVIPADSVEKIGLTTLHALVASTHKMVDRSMGRVRKMADGGLVDNSPMAIYNRASATYASMSAPAATPAATPAITPAPTQAPAAAAGNGGVYQRASQTYQDIQSAAPAVDAAGAGGGLHFANGGVVTGAIRRMADGGLAGFAGDAAAQVADAVRKGNYSDAAGQAIRGALALPGVALGAAGANAYNGIARPVGNALYTAATGNNTSGPAPAAAAPNALAAPAAVPAATFRPGDDSRASETQPATPIPTLNGASGVTVQGAPGVSKFVQGGKTLYSNVAGSDNDTLMSKNPGVQTVPSFTSGQPGGAIAALTRSPETDQPGALSNGSGMIVLGGPNASFFRQAGATGSAAQMASPSLSTIANGAVSGREQARLANAAAIAAEQNATMRADTQTTAAAHLAGSNIAAQSAKYGADTSAGTAAARLATETPGIQAKTDLTTQQVTAGKRLQDLQKQYLAATDPVQRRQLYEALIASQGHVRSLAERFTVIPQGSQVDASTGLVTHNPSKLFDNQLGKEVELSEPTSGAGSTKQQLPAGLVVGAATKQADGTYSAAGKTITIKGGKVTAIQ